ncbi:MAG: hypothetical protein WCP18_01045 [bacterium]
MTEIRHQQEWDPIDFTVYFSFVKWYVLAGIILEIIWRSWAVSRGGAMLENLEIGAWILRGFIFAVLGWRSLKNFGASTPVTAISGALAGLAIGLVIAVLRFWDGFHIWKFFNLINETFFVAIAGCIISIIFMQILNLLNRKK